MGRIKGIFLSNPPWWVKKNSTQPNLSHNSNPTHMDRVEPMDLTNFIVIIIIIIIIIKLSRKKYKYKYILKTQRLVSMQFLKGKQHK